MFLWPNLQQKKIQTVSRYIKGNESIKKLAKEVGVSTPILSGWIRLYEQSGIEAFNKSPKLLNRDLQKPARLLTFVIL